MGQPKPFLLSVIVPCFNEQGVLELTHSRLIAVLGNRKDFHLEIIYVDDGSTDQTVGLLNALQKEEPRVRLVRFSRNFGHQAAISAGVDHASGDAIAIIDGDLQDPPETILEMIPKWRQGNDVVFGVRTDRKEGVAKRAAYFLFYSLWSRLAEIDVPVDSGDFCLMDRRVADAIRNLPERQRFLRGLRAWVGFRQLDHEYERMHRAGGKTKYSLRKLIGLALDGIFDFSIMPLRLIFFIAMGTSALAMVGIILAVTQRIAGFRVFGYAPADIPGYTTIILVVLLLGGLQLGVLGIIGEYIGRIYMEVKRRPTYMVAETSGFGEQPSPRRTATDSSPPPLDQ